MKNILFTIASLLCFMQMNGQTVNVNLDGTLNCPGAQDVTYIACDGTLADDGGTAGNYNNASGDYNYTFCSPDGLPITLTLVDIELAGPITVADGSQCNDAIAIFDGSNQYTGSGGDVCLYNSADGGCDNSFSAAGAHNDCAEAGCPLVLTATSGCFTVTMGTYCLPTLGGVETFALSFGDGTLRGFEINYSVAGCDPANAAANPRQGDGLNPPGPDPGNGSSPSNDFCGTPHTYDGSIGTPGATFSNINTTSGTGIGTNGCDPEATLVTGQGTLETTVYFQYCAQGGETFIDAGINDCAGGAACVGFSLFKTADGAGDPGNACFASQTLTQIVVGTDINPGDILVANTCYIVIADGLNGAECDFCSYFNVDLPLACGETSTPFCYSATSGLDPVEVDICPDAPGGTVTINFDQGQVEDTYDELEVYAGAQGTGAGGVEIYNGYGAAGDVTGLNFTGAADECLSVYVDSDVSFTCATQGFTPIVISVTCVTPNQMPVAVDDTETTPYETDLTSDVSPNDSDPDGDTLTFTDPADGDGTIASAQGGTVAMNPDGSYTYTPPTGFSGTDTFVYQACDPGGLCDSATVTVTVDPPTCMPNAGTLN